MKNPLSLKDLAEVGLSLEAITSAEVCEDGSIVVSQRDRESVLIREPIFARHLGFYLESFGKPVRRT